MKQPPNPLNHPWRRARLSRKPGEPKSTSNGHNLIHIWRKERERKWKR